MTSQTGNTTRSKVLFLIESLSGGGAEKVLSTLVRHIDKQKFDITVCTVVDTGKYVDEVKEYVNYTSIIPNPDKCKTWWQKLKYRLKYKLVYSLLPLSIVYRLFIPKGNDVEVAFIEGFATKLLSKASSKSKKIAWVHTDLVNNHQQIEFLYKSKKEEQNCYNKFDQIIGVSNTVCDSMRTLYGSNLNVKTIYNPIDAQDIINKSRLPKNVPPKKEGVVRICSIGRFVPQKAFDRLLRITHKLKTEGHNVELWLLGDGSLRSDYEKYIEDNNLNDIVTLWGFQSNPYAYLAQCDLFVCSSIAEGYSTAVTEALILSIPIITTDCSGMKELLGQNNEFGIITENNEDKLYTEIKNTLDSPNNINCRTHNIANNNLFIEAYLIPIESILL